MTNESLPSLPDIVAPARRANAKLQRLENERARREGRPPRDLNAERKAAFRAAMAARAEARNA